MPRHALVLIGATGCSPGTEHSANDARGRPIARSQPPHRFAATPASVGCGPVVGRWQPAVQRSPRTHRGEHLVARPAPLDRAGMAGLAVRVGVPLAVARLRVGAAAAAHSPVARLDRSGLPPGRVIEVRLDRRWRSAEPPSDLRNRQSLGVPIMPSERNRAATLNHSICHRRLASRRHPRQVTRAAWCSRPGTRARRAPRRRGCGSGDCQSREARTGRCSRAGSSCGSSGHLVLVDSRRIGQR
jgi:hypothetical protein